MKIRLTLKSVLWTWVVLTLILAGLIMGAYSRLNPDSFLVLLNQQVQRNYPGSELTVRNIDYTFKLDFSLTLSELTVKKAQLVLGKAQEVEVRIPWWVLLFNTGSAQVNIQQLDIFVNPLKDPVNLAKDLKPSGGKISISIPSYMSQASYTLRAKNISIREMGGERRYFTISKLLVREFQQDKNSAFEVNVPIKIAHKNNTYTSELWLFGDVTPKVDTWSLNYRGEFRTKESTDKYEFEDLVIDGRARFNPGELVVASNFDLIIDKKTVGSGEFKSPGNQLDLSLKLTALPVDFLNLVGEEIRNPFWTSMDGTAVGDLNFKRDFGRTQGSTLSGKLNFAGGFMIPGHTDPILGNWQLNFQNGKWETSFLTPKHDVSFFRRAAVDFKKGSVSQYSQELGFSNVDLSVALPTIESLGELMSSSPKDYHSTFISIKDCRHNDQVYNGHFRLGILPDQRFYELELGGGDSKVSARYQGKLSSNQFEADFSNHRISELHNYFSPAFTAKSALLNGKIQGKWTEKWTDGSWITKLTLKDLESTKGALPAIVNDMVKVFNLDLETYKEIQVESSVSKKELRISSIRLESADPAVLSGLLSFSNGKSQLTLNYPKNKKWKPVVKEASGVLAEKESL